MSESPTNVRGTGQTMLVVGTFPWPVPRTLGAFMINRLFTAIFVALSLVTGVLYTLHAAEEITVTIQPARSILTIGDVVPLTITVQHPAEDRLLPTALGPTWGPFEVRSQSPVQTTQQSNGSASSQQVISVTLWQTGSFATPPLTLQVLDAQGNQHPITATAISLTVNSVLQTGDESLRDLKPQATLPLPVRWPWIAGGLLAILLIGAGLWWWLRRTAPLSAQPISIPDLRPAYQIALDEIARIEGLHLPALDRYKEHYTLIIDVLRRYLQATYGIPALDQTTDELRRTLRNTPLPVEQRDVLFTMLSEADLVKFAKVTPDYAAAQQLPAQARHFVLNAQPLITPAGPEAITPAEAVA